jgi:hypothetical protein
MKTTVSLYDFRREFEQCRPNNFSYEGLAILFEYIEGYEDSMGEEIELDIISICCDFTEDSFQNIADQYGIELDSEEDEDYQKQQVIDHLENQGVLIGDSDNGIIYQNY